MFSELEVALRTQTADCQILYLPTYRRIEKDLSLIFPEMDESAHSVHRRKDLLSTDTQRDFIELVEFGMEDVDETFRQVQAELVRKARWN